MAEDEKGSRGDGEGEGWQPTGRRGACCFSHDGAVYVFQGYEGGFPFLAEPILYRFVLGEGRWEAVRVNNYPSMSSVVSGACCCLLGERNNEQVVTFGGWINGERVADVHTLDLCNMAWSKCGVANPAEGPLLKDKAGIIPYGSHMVCVVGGYGYPSPELTMAGIYHGQAGAQYHWDSINDLCWTNEVHLFHLSRGKWINPQISGQRPPPCAAFSLTMADSCRAVLFGGRQREMRVNHVYILHLDTWHWEGVFLQSSPAEPWPSARSFHTTCSLTKHSLITKSPSSDVTRRGMNRFDWLPCAPPDLLPSSSSSPLRSRLLVLWGMDNVGDPVPDCWLLELDPITWKKIDIPDCVQCQPRLWHVAGVCHPTPTEASVVVFGGTKRNLFTESGESISETVVFESGVSSLYSLCVRHLSLLPDSVLAVLPSVIPTHIAREIEQQVTANRNYRHFPPIRF